MHKSMMLELHRGESPTRGITPHGVTKKVILRGFFNSYEKLGAKLIRKFVNIFEWSVGG